MSNTDRMSMLERWADGMEKLEQYYEGIYGPPATPPSLPPITTRDAMLEAIADGMERAKRNINKKSTTYHSDSVAYVKTVPSGDVHYASLDSVGGRTLAFNQLVDSGTTSVATISGHKYYTLIDGTASIVTADGTAITIVDDTADMVCDLTLCFGSGNEPTSVAEFQQTFPALWYAFTQGQLLSAGVTEVVSQGKNLADYSGGQGYPSNTALSNTTKRIFEVGKYVVGLTANNYYGLNQVTNLVVGDNNISFTPTQGAYGVGIPFNCKSGTTYTLNVKTISMISVAWYKEDGTYISYRQSSSSAITETAPAEAVQGVFVLRSASANTSVSYQDVQVEVGSKATSYSAPFTNEYSIPAEIQALEGYGWSAGSVYNYIDYEAKKFVQNVASVDLSTLTWGYGPSVGWSATLNTKNPADDDTVFNGISATLTPVTRNAQATAFSGGTDAGMVSVSGGKVYVGTGDIGIVPSGTLYYELATPQETDISEYLTDDNLISVESGGTLSFPNALGDDYRIDVPSSVTFVVGEP